MDRFANIAAFVPGRRERRLLGCQSPPEPIEGDGQRTRFRRSETRSASVVVSHHPVGQPD
jgi:hypothetical protein